ncbi:uncharacterized protein CANTADRAFT_230261 [Suhomyces tanzawaensis NRRL Y-17324]|uniref:Galactose oxidase n=1 Tax=Suhomyces tanzawaensis NRRL Y-17324 TaxID=984487 RepID=A0A1E4SL50_9ASCO|nr:uncharacterized protein CANTADRAFT_230261 [Suhomyces tanzawaensis NRRL Y-17324]ODV80241.1 hypothetical protein CANTADRAFT_230261 [Suhomyces tanzawaensis NRRL Y-17324]
MKGISLLVALYMVVAVKSWNTLYSYADEKIYLHLSNNDLLALNFSITGFDKLLESRLQEVELNNGQRVDGLQSPPLNSTLFLVGQQLYGITKGGPEEKDVCGNGVLNIIRYDSSKNEWMNDIKLGFDGISDASFYKSSTVLTSPTNNETIYIYGGQCEKDGKVSSRMISIDMKSFKAANISTSTKPQPFFGASNLLAPNPQTQLVIGGQSNGGWLNMYQLATWDFSSGWSFKQISNGPSDEKLNSRMDALVLPMFDPLENNTISTISDKLKIRQVLLIGGMLLDSYSKPSLSKLLLNSNDWSWNTSIASEVNVQEMMGAATIFNTLVVVNTSQYSNKRDDPHYQLSLYDADSFAPVKSLKKNFAILHSSSNVAKQGAKSSVTTKAIIGTVIPLCALVMGLAGMLLYKKYKRTHEQKFDDMSEVDYHFGSYFDNSSAMTSNMKHIVPPTNYMPTSRRVMTEAENNETSSTLEVASFDSWIKKREKFDQKRVKTNNRHSYLASNETLSSNTSDDGSILERRYNPVKPQPAPVQYSTNLVNRSVSMIKKSFSFTNTPTGSASPEYGILNNKVRGRAAVSSKVFDDENNNSQENVFADPKESEVDIAKSNMFNEKKQDEDEQVSDSDLSVDDKMDVQVLVSSKRRSVLKVVNPDLKTIEDVSDSDVSHGDHEVDLASMRQRIPSGGKLLDE